MFILFKLTMPQCGSWNGKWSGENRDYSQVINFGRTKKGIENGKSILAKKHFYYDFGDEWTAMIGVQEIDGKEATRIRRKRQDFCGYDWMIMSIIENGIITTRKTDFEETKNIPF